MDREDEGRAREGIEAVSTWEYTGAMAPTYAVREQMERQERQMDAERAAQAGQVAELVRRVQALGAENESLKLQVAGRHLISWALDHLEDGAREKGVAFTIEFDPGCSLEWGVCPAGEPDFHWARSLGEALQEAVSRCTKS